MNVLVACEFSGIVRDAFEDAGWNAWSCDLLPTESEQTKAANKHLQGDILRIIKGKWYGCKNIDDVMTLELQQIIEEKEWDLLIGHPPCTYLSYAYTGKERYSIERLQNKINAYQFFLDLWDAPIEHICLENPMGYIHSGLLPCSQIIEPYYFGDPYKKKTCLWLKNLPPLQYSKEDTMFEKKTAVKPEYHLVDGGNKVLLPRKYSGGKGKQKKLKSKFHKGIAAAMAEQWTEYLLLTKKAIK